MKAKSKIVAAALALMVATFQVGCNSKTENKAENVQEEYKDVVDAQREGDTTEVREEKAELDSARQDYKELAKDSAARKNDR